MQEVFALKFGKPQDAEEFKKAFDVAKEEMRKFVDTCESLRISRSAFYYARTYHARGLQDGVYTRKVGVVDWGFVT
jgi:hypothetical protein